MVYVFMYFMYYIYYIYCQYSSRPKWVRLVTYPVTYPWFVAIMFLNFFCWLKHCSDTEYHIFLSYGMIKSYNIKKVWNQNLQVLFFIGGVWKLLHNKIYSSKFQSWYGTASYLPWSINYMEIGSCSKKNMNLSSFIFIHCFLVITLITSLPLLLFY